ncbi:MAG TPA: phage holin family protein [Steroidobacteraceae bacterium]|nr:phage holin family protein [Steroidobacteraceae bacterium]
MSAQPNMGEAVGNFSCSIARLAQTASSYARERVNRADAAIEGESRRRLWVLLSALALLLWMSTGILFAGFAVIAAFWDTNRVIATASVATVFLALAAFAGWTLMRKWQQRPSVLEGLIQLLALFLGRRR